MASLGPNTIAAIFAALQLTPFFVKLAEGSGKSSAEKHADVAKAVDTSVAVAGALAGAKNPAYKTLIDSAIQTTVASFNEAGWDQPISTPALVALDPPPPATPPVSGTTSEAAASKQ